MLKLWENQMLSWADRLEAANSEIDRVSGLLDLAAVDARKWNQFIGPLMDEFDALPNDVKEDDEFSGVVEQLERIAQSIAHEGEGDDDDGA